MNFSPDEKINEKVTIWGFTSGYRVPQVMQCAHRHHEIEINFLASGSMTYLASGGLIRVPAERLAVFWAAAPHQVIALDGNEPSYWFTIPFAWIAQWRMAENFMQTLLQGAIIGDEIGDAGDEVACARWHADLQSGDVELIRAAGLEMEARLRRLVRGNRGLETIKTTPIAPEATDAVQKMAEVIARGYAGALSVAQIAAPTGLHPNYAMALFRSACGMSLVDYLTQHRLFHARRLLLTTDLKSIEVALESGFGSLSRFYEAFSRANDCSPQRFRRQNRGV